MNPNEIENAMRDEKQITPSPDFSARVMRAVRDQADRSQGLEFPWRIVLPGVVACALFIVGGLITGARGVDMIAASEALARAVPLQVTALVPTSLLATLVLVWWSMRLAGDGR